MDASYTGHYETGGNNRVKDADDVFDEDSDIELGPGAKVKICVSFRNSHYLVEHVCQFVANSSVEGWQVMCIDSEFTKATIYCKTKPNDKHITMYCLKNFGQYTDVKCDKIVNNDN